MTRGLKPQSDLAAYAALKGRSSTVVLTFTVVFTTSLVNLVLQILAKMHRFAA